MLAMFKKDKYLGKREYRFLILLFLASFLVRALVYHCYLSKDNRFWQVDSRTCDLVAEGIAEGKGVALPSGETNYYRLPGYPIFAAFFYKFFGHKPIWLLWVQVFLSAIIPLLVYALSRVLFPGMIVLARAASMYAVVHLGFVFSSILKIGFCFRSGLQKYHVIMSCFETKITLALKIINLLF